MEEVWKDILGYEGYYQVSNLGRVRRIKSARGSQIGRIMRGALTSDGYWRVELRINGTTKWVSVHRLVAQAFIPNPENKPEVNHLDGDKLNCCADNLEWVLHQENMHHAWRTGLCRLPSEDTRRKLSLAASNRSEEHKRKLSLAARNRTSEHRRKLGEAHRGKTPSEETRKKLSKSAKGRIWVHNRIQTARIRPENLQEYLNAGYTLGRPVKEN